MTAFLKFGGMRGHDHYDALNLVWFAGGKEVFSDTGYLPIPGSGATREWISDTASHMTVAVDEQKHLQNRGSLVIPERHKYTSYNSYPPPVPRFYADRYPAEASLPGAAEFFNQGRLLLWDATRPEVQAMEAEQENAYPGLATLFRRTIVMVSFGKGEGYLVDIFRVRGGQTHDYFLRGGLDEPYEMRFDASLSPDQRTLYSHINVHSTAEVDEKMKAEVLYKNGLKTTSRLAGVFGTDSATQHLFVGEAPAIRRMGTAPFSVLRRSGEAPLDSCFVWVHEVSAGASRIKEVDATQDGGNVMLKVTRTDDTEDIILSGSSDDSRFAFDGISFEGRLAFLSDSRSAVFSGGPLIKTTQTLAEAAPFLSGKLLSSTSKDNGDEEDSVLVELETGPENTGHPVNVRLAHFDMGDVIRFSIPVSDARWENGKLRVLLEHGPGFEVDDEDTVMTRYPGWRVFSGTSVRLDLHPEKN